MLYLDAVTRAEKRGKGHLIFIILSFSNFRSTINFYDASSTYNIKVYDR